MTDEQASDWECKMICCLGISTSNSDINVVGLHKTVKELYEQGRADEREAMRILLADQARSYQQGNDFVSFLALSTLDMAIQQRGNHEPT